MSTASRKPLIIISYAHADEPEHPAEGEVKWLSFVTGYLRPAIKHGAVDLWLDRLMPGGADWEREIEHKIRACDIFILLVSRHSLSSDYVVDKEIAIVRERQAKGEAIHFYPIVLTPTPKIALDLVRDKNLRPRDGKPLSDYSINERYRHMSDAADEIAEIATGAAKKNEMLDDPGPPRTPARIVGNIYLGKVARVESSLSAAFVDYGGDKTGFLHFQEINPEYYQIPIKDRAQFIEGYFNAISKTEGNIANRYPTKQERAERFVSPQLGHLYKIEKVIKNRQTLLVQVVRDAPRASTGARLTTFLSIPGRYVVLTANDPRKAVSREINPKERERLKEVISSLDLPEGMGIILRASSAKRKVSEITRDLNRVLRQWETIRELTLRSNAPTLVYEDAFGRNDERKSAELPEPNDPTPHPNVDAPFAYGWTTSRRVAVVTGAQNLPFYRYFSSEEDHRRALEAARVGVERLLKALRDGRYNARREYGEALEYYLADLPTTAGAGNILLANDQVRILHDMFLADALMLSEGLASRLKSVIANQFALNAFYDLVQRHNEAVNAGNWSRPFPLDEAKSFFGAVEDNTPRWFEPQVEQGLRQVEQAAPPSAAAAPEPSPASTIEPPPLPPGTPDAQDSWKRQMATSANALWETFLQGRDMPVAQDEWRKTADVLGAHVRPIIEFLREQERGKE
jgi:Ribonuclease E/G family/TIR domain